jgi:hypothetical protein
MHFFAHFFTGALLCNALPHLAAGLQGRPFPSPFATPSGVGDSSPLVNVLWGFVNLLGGLALWTCFPAPVGLTPEFGIVCLGVLLLGMYLALHFGRVQRQRMSN